MVGFHRARNCVIWEAIAMITSWVMLLTECQPGISMEQHAGKRPCIIQASVSWGKTKTTDLAVADMWIFSLLGHENQSLHFDEIPAIHANHWSIVSLVFLLVVSTSVVFHQGRYTSLPAFRPSGHRWDKVGKIHHIYPMDFPWRQIPRRWFASSYYRASVDGLDGVYKPIYPLVN